MKSTALQTRRIWIAGGMVAAVLIVAASWLLLIKPKFASASSLRSQAADAQMQATQLSAKVRRMAEEDRHYAVLRARLAAALEALPPDSGLPAFTREVAAAAAQSHVTVTSIAVGTVTPVVAAESVPTDTSTTSTSGSPDASSTVTAPTPGSTSDAPATSQFTLGVTLTSAGKLTAQTRFLSLLEHGARRVLVTSTNVTASTPSTTAPGGNAVVGGTVDTSATMTTSLTLFSSTMSPGQLASVQKLLSASS